MKEFESVVIGKSSIPALSITIILMVAMTVVFCIYWLLKNKQNTNISYLIAGALGFMVSARVLELGVHYFCIIMDNPVSRCIVDKISHVCEAWMPMKKCIWKNFRYTVTSLS